MIVPALALCLSAWPARAATIQVVIDKLVFSPSEVTAKVGDTIEWVNKDNLAHTATVKGGWDVMIPARKSGTLVLDREQSVDYFCRFHPNMKAHLTVTAR
jgi:plastocyanin